MLFLILAAAAHFENLPWELLGLAASVFALAVATTLQPANGPLHSVTAGFVVLFGALHVISTLETPVPSRLFANAIFVERVIGAVLLITAGVLCRRSRQVLDSLLLAAGLLWMFIAVGAELVRWDLATIALLANWLFVLVAASVWIPGRKLRWADDHPVALGGLVALTSWWAAIGTQPAVAWVSLIAAALAVTGLAVRKAREGSQDQGYRLGTVVAAALTAALWALALPQAESAGGLQFLLLVAGVTTLLAIIAVHRVTAADDERTDDLVAGAAIGYATVLASATLIHISRHPWAWALELCCLAGLALAGGIRATRGRSAEVLIAGCVTGTALIVQAHLLRQLGPAGPLSVASVMDLRLPAVVSLLWAAMGCVMTFWSRKIGSRALWIAGAALLIVTAVKLLLVDFGSLGQLANILAVIAAGAVFMLVGWVAPMPPAATKAARPKAKWDPVNIAALIAAALGAIEVWRLVAGWTVLD